MLTLKEEEISQLTEKFLKGEVQAFESMARLVASDIINIAFRYMGNLEDAKDISQEVLFKIYRRMETFAFKSKISTWILPSLILHL